MLQATPFALAHIEEGEEMRRVLSQLDEIVNFNNIKSLVVPTSILWIASIRIFENLTQLEITCGWNFQNLHLVFHHAGRLQSLTFVDPQDRKLFQVLAENSSELPLLSSFKIKTVWHGPPLHSSQNLLQLSEFLKTKVHLRRLDMHLMCFNIIPFLKCLQDLPSIEILGLCTGADVFAEDDYLSLAKLLPPKTTALRLTTRWEITPDNREAVDILVSLCPSQTLYSKKRLPLQMQRLNSLSFFYICNIDLPSVFLIDELASELKHLSIIGMDKMLSYVDRTTEYAEDGVSSRSSVETSIWSWRRTHYRTVTDFGGCKDYEWLLRHHSLLRET
jgi:hypothetical protein